MALNNRFFSRVLGFSSRNRLEHSRMLRVSSVVSRVDSCVAVLDRIDVPARMQMPFPAFRRARHVAVRCTYSPQPEPDFNDISGLSDLKDLDTDPNTPRFVPTFSRVARRGFAKRYELFPGGPIDTDTDKEGEDKEGTTSHVPEEIMDLPRGPTHKEMLAARRHYLKRQARRGLLPPSRPIRKRFPLDDS